MSAAAVAIAVISGVTGCGNGDADAGSPTVVPSEPATSTPSTVPPSDDGSASPPPAPTPTEDRMDDRSPLAQAIADLAERTGESRDDIAVNAHEQVTWRDGALGCPKPGMMYTQALVDGYRIVLEVNGELFHYHGAGGREPFYCDQPDRGGTLGPQTDR